MKNFEKTMVKQNNAALLNRDFQVKKINQLKKASDLNSQGNCLSKTKKVLVTSTIALAISLGIDYGKPNSVVAQAVSATWAETITL